MKEIRRQGKIIGLKEIRRRGNMKGMKEIHRRGKITGYKEIHRRGKMKGMKEIKKDQLALRKTEILEANRLIANTIMVILLSRAVLK